MPKVKDEDLATRTRRRVTRHLIPYLMFIYILAYMDRANLGVAKLQMQGNLGFSDAVIGFGAGIFFLGYPLLDIPGSLLVEHWSARKWITRIMFSWGIIAMLMGLIGSPLFAAFGVRRQFYALRLLLGTAEAGFFPGIIVYLSHWFRYEDRARAKTWFMVSQPIAIAVSIPLSRWILQNIHWYGLAGWRWVFVLEGCLPILFGFVTLFYLPDRPDGARWLPVEEKEWLSEQLEKEIRQKTSAHRVRVRDAFCFQTLLLTAVGFLMVTGNQALVFFLPSITNSMAHLSIPARTAAAALPYVCSAAGIVLNGLWTQLSHAVRWHTAIPMLATGIFLGCAILAGHHSGYVIGLFCLAGFTSQAYLPAFWTIPTMLLGKSAAAISVGLISLSSLGGFVGPYIFGYLKGKTGSYQDPLWFLVASMIAAGLLATQIRTAGRHGIN